MILSDMRTRVRRDLHDEDSENFRWSNDEIDRHIAHAVSDFSDSVPLQMKATLSTVDDSREIDISSLTDRVRVHAVEYPVDQFPKRYQRYSLWSDIVTLLGDEIPDGSDCYVYYGKLHTLDAESSTIESKYADLIATGAVGYAAMEWAAYSVNRVNVGGKLSPGDFLSLGKENLYYFRSELKRLSKKDKVRIRSLYKPYYPSYSQTTDFGP
jgi:hypothetical protein